MRICQPATQRAKKREHLVDAGDQHGSGGSATALTTLPSATAPGAHAPELVGAPSTVAVCVGVASAVTAALSGELGAGTPK